MKKAWTALHEAAKQSQLTTVRQLLAEGANPNVREPGDNTYPLHWAAASGNLRITEALLDAGADVRGRGDVHKLDVIGWATVFNKRPNKRVIRMLLDFGAQHHIFSAIAIGDVDAIREVAKRDPQALKRKLSRFEKGLTPLHFAMSRKRYDLLEVLIEAGAPLEAKDEGGHTALEAAILRRDRRAEERLRAAGAKTPKTIDPARALAGIGKLSASVKKGVPMLCAPDVARTLEWYAAIGFREIARYGENGVPNFGMVAFGDAEIMFNQYGKPGPETVSVWLYTGKVDKLYQLLQARPGVDFVELINDTFYGARQFGIRDPNGYILYFIQTTPTIK